MKTNHLLSIILTGLFIFSSCETDVTPPDDVDNTTDPLAVINLLHDGAAWETVYDSMMLVPSLVGRENSSTAGISDFTVDTKNRLNIVFWHAWQSQQSVLYTSFRKSINLTTMKPADLGLTSAAMFLYSKPIDKNPPYFEYGVSYYTLMLEAYKPYTNFYVDGFQHYKNGMKNYLMKVQAANEESGVNDFREYQSGDFDMAFRNPTVNLGNRGIFTFGANMENESSNYVGTIHQHYLYMESAATHGGLTEPRTDGTGVAIEFRADELEATTLETGFGTHPNTNIKWMINRTSVAKLPLTNPLELPIKTHRHYSVDGNILAFYIYEEKKDKYSTFVYNFSTKQLTKILDNVSIAYGNKEASDVDLDEAGNLYYTGYAKNGSDKTGTSVYKISAGGASSLVGSDGFLKYGTPVKLKYLHGKVYLGVVGTRPETGYRQITVLRQK
jgi:hypothetical protein